MVHLTAKPEIYEGQLVIIDPNYADKNKPEQMVAVVTDSSNPNYVIVRDAEGTENTHHNSNVFDIDSSEASKIISKYRLEDAIEEFEDDL